MEVSMLGDRHPDGWHYRLNGQVCGPISIDQLKQLVQAGKVGPSQPVWCEDQRHTMIFLHARHAAFGVEQHVVA